MRLSVSCAAAPRRRTNRDPSPRDPHVFLDVILVRGPRLASSGKYRPPQESDQSRNWPAGFRSRSPVPGSLSLVQFVVPHPRHRRHARRSCAEGTTTSNETKNKELGTENVNLRKSSACWSAGASSAPAFRAY